MRDVHSHVSSGDSLSYHNGNQFSTFDSDHDRHVQNCAVDYKGGLWYNACHEVNLNGPYYEQPACDPTKGVIWYRYKGHSYSLKFSEMKLKKSE